MHQVTPQAERFLEILQGEMTRGKPAKKLGLKGRLHFAKSYLKRAIDSGYIEWFRLALVGVLNP